MEAEAESFPHASRKKISFKNKMYTTKEKSFSFNYLKSFLFGNGFSYRPLVYADMLVSLKLLKFSGSAPAKLNNV